MENIFKDSQGRIINYLRISVTDRCNLNCCYCNSSKREFIPHDEILSYEEIIKTTKIMSEYGIKKVRLTGGEPLVRKDIDFLVKEINKIEKINEITLTTNGTLLPEYAKKLKKAGIKRLNISLDTLNSESFIKISGKDKFNSVLDGIKAAGEEGFSPIKLNTVILNNLNSGEIEELAGLSIENDFHIRFIELMPIANNAFYENHQLCAASVKKTIENKFGILEKAGSKPMSGPASMYKIKNSKGQIGFIHAMTSHFCADCNRIRLTADGKIRPCLLEDNFFDLKTLLRNGADDKKIIELINKALLQKASAHEFMPNVKTRMVSIGG
ncbi:MAG: GTP 3',8-cyclase MoaA [Desulforegulaceae bacterium]|nr:GTP 3',8-cyclase MoaA [Desulforegulaceae bacterium]